MSHPAVIQFHRSTVEVVVESPTIVLAKRIRVLINVTGLSREECHEVIMSGKNIPTEEEFYLAWNAAKILAQQ